MMRLPLTSALICVSIIVYLYMAWFGKITMLSLFISEYFSPTLPEIQNGQIWRLITPIFLHFSIFHIVFNMLWTWEFGRMIEARQGTVALLLLVAAVGVASNLAQYYVSGPIFGGMSGVIYGLFGYCWIQSKTNREFGVQLNPGIVKLLLLWLVVCWSGVLRLMFDLEVANTAHTVGLVAGVLVSFLVSYSKRGDAQHLP